jgi:hypothetical protein
MFDFSLINMVFNEKKFNAMYAASYKANTNFVCQNVIDYMSWENFFNFTASYNLSVFDTDYYLRFYNSFFFDKTLVFNVNKKFQFDFLQPQMYLNETNFQAIIDIDDIFMPWFDKLAPVVLDKNNPLRLYEILPPHIDRATLENLDS